MKKLIQLLILILSLSGCAGSKSIKSYLRKHPISLKPKPKCQTYQLINKQIGHEVSLEPARLDDLLIVYIPNGKIYKKLFHHRRDGLQLDMVSRNQFGCDTHYERIDEYQMGTLFAPLYKRKLRRNTLTDSYGRNYVIYGEAPAGAHSDSTDFNLIVIQRNKNCAYLPFNSSNDSHWELLPTGLFNHQLSAEDSVTLQSKTIFQHLFFRIPFAQNQSEFSQEDIRPLYDSLNLTDFDIREIVINAYTSIEGSRYHNHQLAERRAESIVKALQTFQNPRILSHVNVHENFAEFRKDITKTPYAHLAKLSNEQILESLNDEILVNLDTILAKHRKAEIDLLLDKKLDLKTANQEEIIEFFDHLISRKHLSEALLLQNFVFNQIDHNLLPESFLNQLEIPNETDYAPIFANLKTYELDAENESIEMAMDAYKKLFSFTPKSAKILYNLTSLQIKGFAQGMNISSSEIQKNLTKLRSLKLDKSLHDRLMVNYQIVMTEWYDLNQRYREKRNAIKTLQSIYKNLQMTDEDRLKLARYLSEYRQFDAAIQLLKDRILENDASFDLQNLYLWLTIGNPENYKKPNYITFIDQFQKDYPEAICKLFLPKSQGGFSFQLLEHPFWKVRYCELCEN